MSYRYQGDIISQGQYENYLKEGKTVGLELPWKDIGYNLGLEMVDGKLQVMNGRPLGSVGAHCQGFNSRSIGICLVGNYDAAPPSDDRIFLLASLCRQLQIEFGIPRDQVIGHRESYGKLNPPQPVAKTCPGSAFDLDAFRKRLRD
jgi:N-acetylmuramoyl-L-alanine amidase